MVITISKATIFLMVVTLGNVYKTINNALLFLMYDLADRTDLGFDLRHGVSYERDVNFASSIDLSKNDIKLGKIYITRNCIG